VSAVSAVLPGGRLTGAARATATETPLPVRPVWLLAAPQPLHTRDHQPWLDGGELQLLSGPERIETGWWDEALAERDYFIAQAADGALVWVYRARLPQAAPGGTWFLQGRFG
jgi:protein ImuB